jgi:hypothetical protein
MTNANSQSLRAESALDEDKESFAGAIPVAISVASELTAEEAARSATNIALWRVYLPEDCVAAMISMGWDLTA